MEEQIKFDFEVMTKSRISLISAMELVDTVEAKFALGYYEELVSFVEWLKSDKIHELTLDRAGSGSMELSPEEAQRITGQIQGMNRAVLNLEHTIKDVSQHLRKLEENLKSRKEAEANPVEEQEYI